MAIFNSYVKLPEGIHICVDYGDLTVTSLEWRLVGGNHPEKKTKISGEWFFLAYPDAWFISILITNIYI